MEKQIRDAVRQYLPQVREFRHELHKIPEIAGKEFKTAQFVRKKLAQLPALEIRKSFLQTDVTALLGDKPLLYER